MVPGEKPLDGWSWAHFASGAVLAFMPISLFACLLLLTAYEAFEQELRLVGGPGEALLEYESQANIVADVLVGVGGFVLVRIFR
jgi:hypothetical protein